VDPSAIPSFVSSTHSPSVSPNSKITGEDLGHMNELVNAVEDVSGTNHQTSQMITYFILLAIVGCLFCVGYAVYSKSFSRTISIGNLEKECISKDLGSMDLSKVDSITAGQSLTPDRIPAYIASDTIINMPTDEGENSPLELAEGNIDEDHSSIHE